MGVSKYFFDKMLQELRKRESDGRIQIPSKKNPIKKEESELFKFAVLGDPQVSNYMFARESCFYSACLDIANSQDNLDALVVVGDITENGMECEWNTVSHLLNGIAAKVDSFVLAVGNHDIRLRPFKAQLRVFNRFISSTANALKPGENVYYHSVDFPCCRFIVMGADRNSFEAAYISDRQLKWLDGEIEKAQCENKIAFVFNHQPLELTHNLPDSWLGKGDWRGHIGKQSDRIKAIFEKHNNVVFVTGHLHMGANQYSVQDYGQYKCVSVPTVGAGNHGEYSPDSQVFLFSVFEDRLKIQTRLCGKGDYGEGCWELETSFSRR